MTTHMREESKNKIGQHDQYLGQGDLKLHPLWKNEWLSQPHSEYEPFLMGHPDQDQFEKLLTSMGADLKYGYTSRVVLHRNRTNNDVNYGLYIHFKERTDKWWMNNMMAVSDIVRNVSENEGSIRATGMRESLNEDSPLLEVMINAAEQQGFFEFPVIMVDEGIK